MTPQELSTTSGRSPREEVSTGDDTGYGGGGDAGATLHYGIALAEAMDMPEPILVRARAVAELLELMSRQRVDQAGRAAVGEGDGGVGSTRGLRQMYLLVHRLACK